MQTEQDVAAAFRAELLALLARYNAELDAKDHYDGHSECGSDVRMTVSVPGIWDAHCDMLREPTQIDLGAWLAPDTTAGRQALAPMLLATPVTYALPGGVSLERCAGRSSAATWAVRQAGHCLSTEGVFVHEPMPSRRDAVFLAHCRFASAEAAYAMWEKHVASRQPLPNMTSMGEPQ
ncbi:hypothetical protein E4T66_18485 [Sinimarinibacterium sp. CAU 1509]|uniref:hypothetical protein n=1 Tax=Sinimarinibacterium sp. CAU 1509 TaxID=2562283 RepID=UPI0010AB6597|nr:hypothetical protein [Sinimarinibacterium sp. CAU 1509]TJY57395.1 hypothetical protein E4T66_18485 [Sinimarinibacterium sp. CAU 1509]